MTTDDDGRRTPEQVMGAVRAYISEHDDPAGIESWRVFHYTSSRLKVDISGSHPRTLGNRDRLAGQVTRALDKLASAGELHKVGKGTRGPAGGRGREVKYYTQAQWDVAVARAARERVEAEDAAARWESIAEALAGRGLDAVSVETYGTRRIAPTASEWERLLGLSCTCGASQSADGGMGSAHLDSCATVSAAP